MAFGLGAGRWGNGRPIFSHRSNDAWIDDLWLAGAENLEWSDCAVFSVLAAELRRFDSARACAPRLVWMAHLEVRAGLDQRTERRSDFSLIGRRHFRAGVLHQDGALG